MISTSSNLRGLICNFRFKPTIFQRSARDYKCKEHVSKRKLLLRRSTHTQDIAHVHQLVPQSFGILVFFYLLQDLLDCGEKFGEGRLCLHF